MALAEAEIGIQTDVPGITRPMTYEEYVSGPEEMARYDILDGWKVYRLYGDKLLPSPTRQHQDIALNLAEAFRGYQRASRVGKVIIAPCDVEVTYQPLRSRQPDLLFISQERLEQNAPPDEYAPLSPAPELVVEIVLPSDTPSVLAAKMADYRSVAVREVWVVRSGAEIIEVITLAGDVSRVFGRGEIAASRQFEGLTAPVDTIFEDN